MGFSSIGIHSPAGYGLPSATSGIRRSVTTSHFALTAFETGSAALTEAHRRILRTIAVALNERPLVFGGFVTIWGFADRRGSEADNRELGRQRADAVRTALVDLVSDPATAAEIRAYGYGEPEGEGPETDDPSLRKVEVTVTRRQLDFQLAPRDVTVPVPALGPGRTPALRPTLPLPTAQTLPRWMQVPLQGPQRQQIDLNAVSRAITDGLRQPLAGGLAPLARSIANAFGAGVSEREVRQWLDEQMVSGGEAALRAALRAVVTAIAGQPSTPPPLPYGPDVRELPTPRIFGPPPIRF